MVKRQKSKGVRQRSSGSWVSEIRHPTLKHGRIWLGTFRSKKCAKRAYKEAVCLLSGKTPKNNFLDGQNHRLVLPARVLKKLQRDCANVPQNSNPENVEDVEKNKDKDAEKKKKKVEDADKKKAEDVEIQEMIDELYTPCTIEFRDPSQSSSSHGPSNQKEEFDWKTWVDEFDENI